MSTSPKFPPLSPKGLSPEQVSESRSLHGSNELKPQKREPLWHMFLGKFTDPIIVILLVALLLSLLTACYHYFHTGGSGSVFIEPLGVLFAILLATGVAFYFELKSEKEFSVLNQVNDEVGYKVWRSGALTQVLKRDIVVGDWVELETGEEIPADGVLLETLSLEVDESSLTGEPSTTKSLNAQASSESTYPANKLYRGCTLRDGHCLYQVEAVGHATEYGKVFEGAQIDNSVETPLNHQLGGLSRLITRVSYLLALLVIVGSCIVYGLKGGFSAPWDVTFSYLLGKVMIAVTVVVVAVPEGLPMSVSLSLAYSMRSMMKNNNLVRKMHACETMGAATVICTDKTGTLTQNRMMVQETSFAHDLPHELLAESMALNATAHLGDQGDEVLGNPTEGALLLWLRAHGIDYRQLREKHPLLGQLSFSTERKYMASVAYSSALASQTLYVKGAPEYVMALCTLSPEEQHHYEKELQNYQAHALRTIAFAYLPLPSAPQEDIFDQGYVPYQHLHFAGIVGIADPIRPDVPEAIEQCLKAGISIKIVTGDTPGTAREIGRQIGLWTHDCTERNLITGSEFAALSDEELRDRIKDIRIMSRARPMDKERLVRLLQEQGEVVAVTGDGTNDAPALKRAHIGLSMGDGTAVAKEASDITILDNSFSSIVRAVLWGRSLYLNIQRFILFQMTINVVACLVVLLGAFLGTESPLTVTQMLWVNLIMDTFAALALASLPPDRRVMEKKPRSRNANIVTPAMIARILGMGSIFLVLLLVGMQYFRSHSIEQIADLLGKTDWEAWSDLGSSVGSLSRYELSLFFSFFVLLQFWNMFNARAFHSGRSALSGLGNSHKFLFIAGVILLGQFFITQAAYDFFTIAPLDLTAWISLFVVTSCVLWFGEIFRFFGKRK